METIRLTILAVCAMACIPYAYAQSFTEIEPNNPCGNAQLLTSASLPIQVHGYKTQPLGDAVDFFKFSAAPGTRLRVTLDGDFSNPNPLNAFAIGFFPASCPDFPVVEASTIFSPAQIEYTVPADGVSIIGVTACCDPFIGVGTIEGAYVLNIDSLGPTGPTPPTVVGVQTYGSTYGELSARWWQWLLSIPAAVNPNLDTTGANCGLGQYDDVWFLAGTFGGTVERSCTVPAGKPIFFPLINSIAFKPSGKETLTDLRRLAAAFIDSVTELDCTLDGAPCFQDRSSFRVRSPSFTVMAPARGLIPPGRLSVPGNTDPIVSDGYWLLLDPPTPGLHTIKFRASTGSFSLDVTYNLTVQ